MPVAAVDFAPFTVRVVDGTDERAIDDARGIIKEFRLWLKANMDVDFVEHHQSTDHEMAMLPGKYAADKGGILYLVYAPSATSDGTESKADGDGLDAGKCVGCLALLKFDEGVGEVKRMFVSPDARGHKLGHKLLQLVIQEAIRIGYKSLYLDTLSRMTAAIHAYEAAGFVQCDPYFDNPIPDVRYYRLVLST